MKRVFVESADKLIGLANFTVWKDRKSVYDSCGYDGFSASDRSYRIRLEYFNAHSETGDVFELSQLAHFKYDKSWHLRLRYYQTFGFDQDAVQDDDWRIRIEAYRSFGFPPNSKNDPDHRIRLAYYYKSGFTEEAKKDNYWLIRLAAYSRFGYNDDSDNDSYDYIRERSRANRAAEQKKEKARANGQ